MPCYVLKLQSLRVMPVWECRVGQASEALEWFTRREAGLAPHSRATGWSRMNELIRLGLREFQRGCAHASTSAWK